MDTKSKKEVLLSITMLISNRPDTLEKCLNSLKPLLDGISSELILVDTAGDSRCLKIAQRYTSHIIPFSWCNDFAAARNVGLEKANGFWIMYIDDDEWFEDISEVIRFFKEGTYQQYASAAYLTRNYANRKGTSYSDRTANRLCRLEKQTRFKGRIHEQLYPMYEPCYYMKAYVHHYGYAFESEEDKIRHAWRNINLLLEARRVEKDNWMAGAHLVQEYYVAKEYFSLIEIARELRFHKNAYDAGRNDFTAYVSVMEVRSYMNLKRYEVAYQVGKELLAEPRALLIVHLCIANLMPEICLKYTNEKEAFSYCQMFWELYKKWQENEKKNSARDGFSLRGIYLTEERFGKIHMAELHAFVREQNWKEAADSFRKIVWKKIESTMGNTFEDTVLLIAHTDYEEIYTEAMKVLLKGEGSKEYLTQQIQRLEGEAKEKVLYCISRISSKESIILQYQLHYAMLLYDKPRTRQLLQEWKEQNYSFFLLDYEYWKGLNSLQIDLSDWLCDVRIEEWISLTEAVFERMSEKECEDIYQVLLRGLEKTDLRFFYLIALRLEKQLLARNMKLENLDYLDGKEIWDKLYRIASLWVSCAAMLYQKQVFQGDLQTALPARYQFAWLIFQANTVKTDRYSFVKKLAEAAKVYLKMGEVCKYLMRCCKEEEKGSD